MCKRYSKFLSEEEGEEEPEKLCPISQCTSSLLGNSSSPLVRRNVAIWITP